MSFIKPWLSVGSRLGLGSDLGAQRLKWRSRVAVKETKSAWGTSGVPALSHKGLCAPSCSETWPSFPGNSQSLAWDCAPWLPFQTQLLPRGTVEGSRKCKMKSTLGEGWAAGGRSQRSFAEEVVDCGRNSS